MESSANAGFSSLFESKAAHDSSTLRLGCRFNEPLITRHLGFTHGGFNCCRGDLDRRLWIALVPFLVFIYRPLHCLNSLSPIRGYWPCFAQGSRIIGVSISALRQLCKSACALAE